MAIRTVQDLMKTQQELLDRMRKQTDAAQAGGKRALTVVRDEKERELAHLKERFTETEESRDRAVERYERQLAKQREAIGRLEKDLAEMGRQMEKSSPPAGPPPAKRGSASTRKK